MPIKRGHIIVEPKVAAFMSRRETIIVQAKAEHQMKVAEPIVAAVPLVMSRQDVFASSDEPRRLLQQENTLPLKKRGRPKTGRTKENVTSSLDKSIIEFLSSLSNQSETVNNLLMQ